MTADRPRLRILVVATKLPYPPVDGGRLLLWNTATALADLGHELTLVAPHHEVPTREPLAPFQLVHTVPVEETSLVRATVTASVTGRPISIIRHSNPFMHHAVEQLLRNWEFDLVHVEQIHALPHIPRDRITIPVVMRCQNAESELWGMLAEALPHLRWLAGWQARQMRAFEARSVRSADLSITLTSTDQKVLSGLSGLPTDALPVLPAPFPSRLEPRHGELPGSPAVLLLDSQWVPNRDGTDWFLAQIWPEIRRRLPNAVVHVFGNRSGETSAAGIAFHPAPPDSRDVFAPNGILAVPLRIASGVRMKILETWARGVPVVATPAACRGLDVENGDGVLVAATPAEFAEAVESLHGRSGVRHDQVDRGRQVLVERHDPERIALQLDELYHQAIRGENSSGSRPP